ncbi:GNAT family N-acetyltransferase [Halosolutus gelatinilyticus]|uniref:GNAT family N-acetyltransferase n=1 Tax=Halosolutus gelatinilyticus TaxID=2931975 RepID=UPI001FF57A85|nr:GNAT family N-acetyltransferase [Halosolutus gelatinilyticus]
MVEYRPVPDATQAIFHEYVGYAFNPEDGPPEYDPDDVPDVMKLGGARGLYGDDAPPDADPLCVCRHYWFDTQVRGAVHPTPGLSMVASPPEHRRDGHVRRMLAASLEEYRERGARFSVLWPFRYRFYRRYGWDTCNQRATYECDPEALSFAANAIGDAGAYRKIETDDYERLVPVYESHAADYALSIDRDADWWRHRIFFGWEKDPFGYAWERDDEVRGYLLYDIDGDWSDRTMRVRELAFVDREAYLALLAFCYNHDSQVSTVKLGAPADSSLLDLAPDPDEIDREVETGPMVRIVDVADALASLSYPEIDARVTIAVEDEFVDWNDGVFALDAADGAATCRRADADPDARIDVAALAQLAVGYRSAPALEWAGRLDADAETTAALDRLFPETPVYLRDGF